MRTMTVGSTPQEEGDRLSIEEETEALLEPMRKELNFARRTTAAALLLALVVVIGAGIALTATWRTVTMEGVSGSAGEISETVETGAPRETSSALEAVGHVADAVAPGVTSRLRGNEITKKVSDNVGGYQDTINSVQNGGSAAGRWFTVKHPALVREGASLKSKALGSLPVGSAVHVVEEKDGRVRIERPSLGWLSLESGAGKTILQQADGAKRLVEAGQLQHLPDPHAAAERMREVMSAKKEIKEVLPKVEGVFNVVKEKSGLDGDELKEEAEQAGDAAGVDVHAVENVVAHLFK